MTLITERLSLLKTLGPSRDQFCIAGSSGLACLNMLDRAPNDIDVLCLCSAFDEVARCSKVPIEHRVGTDECMNIDCGGIDIELTKRWPTVLGPVVTEADLRHISIATPEFLIMDPSLIAAQKIWRRSPKDLADLETVRTRLKQRAIILS